MSINACDFSSDATPSEAAAIKQRCPRSRCSLALVRPLKSLRATSRALMHPPAAEPVWIDARYVFRDAGYLNSPRHDGEDNPLERAGLPAFDRGPALTACLRNRAPQAVRTVRYKRFAAFFS